MKFDIEIAELPAPKDKTEQLVPPHLIQGQPPPPQQLVLLYSAADWEEFIREWAHYQKTQYQKVVRLGGANDFGIDVACFKTDSGFNGAWDNYQCKHYNVPLAPNDALPEIGKIIWHIFNGNISCPERYVFFSPKDCGPSLKKLLLDSDKLKDRLIEKWDDWCRSKITATKEIDLTGDFQLYFDSFDFGIFEYKPSLEVIEEHSKTPYHSYRFFTVLVARPVPESPPKSPDDTESIYIARLYDAYSDYLGVDKSGLDISSNSTLSRHFSRQREYFYFAEGLKSFSRDSVPQGTFESLHDELLSAIGDVLDEDYDNAFSRLKATTKHAQSITYTSNILSSVMVVQDKMGMCHQLANDSKLCWLNGEL